MTTTTLPAGSRWAQRLAFLLATFLVLALMG
jgi:hypothetical protein